MKRGILHTIAMILLIVGGLNWGLVGAANFDLVAAIFGEGTTAARVVYILVGLSAIVAALTAFAPHHDTRHDRVAMR